MRRGRKKEKTSVAPQPAACRRPRRYLPLLQQTALREGKRKGGKRKKKKKKDSKKKRKGKKGLSSSWSPASNVSDLLLSRPLPANAKSPCAKKGKKRKEKKKNSSKGEKKGRNGVVWLAYFCLNAFVSLIPPVTLKEKKEEEKKKSGRWGEERKEEHYYEAMCIRTSPSLARALAPGFGKDNKEGEGKGKNSRGKEIKRKAASSQPASISVSIPKSSPLRTTLGGHKEKKEEKTVLNIRILKNSFTPQLL